MRLDNLVKVNGVRGKASIPDVLNGACPSPTSQASQQLAGNRELGVQRLWLPLACPAAPLPPPPPPPEHSWKEAHEKRGGHTVSWAWGQVTFPIQHLYKSYLMKLREKKN